MINLTDELQKAFNGDAWHGNNTLTLLRQADPVKVFSRPVAGVHAVAELVLHITAWTEEVLARLTGANAKEPTRGDWPVPNSPSPMEWDLIVADFKNVNTTLLQLIEGFEPSEWSKHSKDERNNPIGLGLTNAQLVNGLIQHHAYHSGQIAILLKF